MPITDLQAIARIKKPLQQAELRRAADDNDQQRFHALTGTSKTDAGAYAEKFEKWVGAVLNNEDKFARFKQLHRFPLASAQIIDRASDEYLKAFDAEDKFISAEFSTETIEVDSAEYLDEIAFDDFLNKTLFNQCLQASGAIWVVDLDSTPNESGYARPEVILREFGQIQDIGLSKRGIIQYVIFALDPIKDESGRVIEKRWAVIDDESYRVFKQKGDSDEPEFVFANLHDLERCPAGFIWHDRLIQDKPLRIQSPLHALFTELDDYVAGNVFSKHADLYAAYPILRSYKTRCRYETPNGETCDNGKILIRWTEGKGDQEQIKESIEDCPMCAKRKPIGPGSHIETPPPTDNLSPDLTNPVGFINAERKLLDYITEKQAAIEAKIILALTGDDGTIDQSNNPVNEDQVQARFEKRKAILSYWAEHLERTHQEILSVLFALRYGTQFIKVSVNYGTEFHLLSPGQAIADYKAARDAGLPMYQLAARRLRIDKVMAGSSETEQMRIYIMSQLEPYPDLPINLVPQGSDAYELKADFGNYIARFERENHGLTVFGKALSMAKRIESIKTILYQYVTDGKAKREVPIVEPQGKPQG
ncbi:hypothetical protein GCM10028805_22600 [Spirosoma harenae]